MTGDSNQDYNNNENSYLLKKITTINENFSFETLKCCDKPVVFLLDLKSDYLSQDLGNLLEKGSLSDCKIQNIPVHKILIETRLGKDFAQVSNYLEENCTLKEIEHLLKWIYSDRIIKNSKRTKEILSYFGIENPSKTKLLKNDLKKLLFDEESSDFKLVIKNDEEDEEEEEEEDEKLPVHKFLLAARSGLFLDLFQNLDQNLNNVQDYSGKSLETLELLISFLYTDEIPITADTDQEFIKEEFEDIVDYYQLNPNIPLLDIFEKCSKK
ncbi:btb/poz domain-containing protein [Anaeramoeba flamelloides]|uniref:Btb/poz domain-containing protein n=1 Tax=Anaeramoeba flamelloides TaxID=1746091 RepID=A0ABQ8Z8A1_9EUKA|nr:btb/poz domain-containing protein [Anaeramoeba flamelloides]